MRQNFNPLISVIVPCFNCAHYLPDTLESLIAQTYKHWECIIIDDGSTDNTKNVVDIYRNRDDRIKYIFKVNEGLSSARNEGLSQCKGEYIQFLDSDDKLSARKFENQLHVFEECAVADLVYAGVKYFTSTELNKIVWVDIAERSGKLQKTGPGMEILHSLIQQNGFVVNAPLVRRNAIDKIGLFDVKLRWVEDWDYWLRGAFAELYFKYDDNESSCALVRVRNGSLSMNIPRMMAASIKVREKMERVLSATEPDKDIDELRRLNKTLKQELKKRSNIVKGYLVFFIKKTLGAKPLNLFNYSLRRLFKNCHKNNSL